MADESDLTRADDATLYAVAVADTLPTGIEKCQMGGNSGFRGMGGPNSACHLHDGTPPSMAAALRKAAADKGTAKPPPKFAAYADLETVDLPGVPLMAAGGPYFGTGSPPEGDFFDDSHLQLIADETRAVADEVRIPIKIGHGKSQKLLKNSGLFTDEQPAGGWVVADNMRVAGGQLLGDLKGVPRKLADLIKAGAFRTRSVELSKVTSQKQGGREYQNVITALALLGAKAPAIRTLDDIIALYAQQDEFPARFADGVKAEPTMIFSTTVQVTDASVDTSIVTDENKTPETKTELTDEQITALAGTFGIEEDDAAKRRDAVLAKFAAHTPKPKADETVPKADDDAKPDEKKDEPVANLSVAMSETELTKLREDASLGRKTHDAAQAQRIEATVREAARQGRIAVADIPQWRGFMEREEEFAVTQLVAMPINPALLRVFGSDDDGLTDADKSEDAAYRAYAQMTGVPTRGGAK